MVNQNELLAEAIKRYPIGTTFKSAVSRKTFISNCEPYLDNGGIRLQLKGTSSCGWGYYNKWAEVVSLPFKNYELW